MPDIIDKANDTADLFLRTALHNRQHAAKVATPIATGKCLHCGAAVLPERRWCDADCRDDWQRGQRK